MVFCALLGQLQRFLCTLEKDIHRVFCTLRIASNIFCPLLRMIPVGFLCTFRIASLRMISIDFCALLGQLRTFLCTFENFRMISTDFMFFAILGNE